MFIKTTHPIQWVIISVVGLATVNAHATCIGINCTCTASTSAVGFGTYDPTSSSNIDTTGNVQVTCSALLAGLNVSYMISLSKGSGTFPQRTMTNTPYTLNYNLYTDSTRSIIWGDGTQSSQTISDSYSLSVVSTTRNYTVYARLPGLQSSAGYGTYTDSITATVTY